ncbi:hypothetical protein [Nocardioides sp.]|uniref:hypothetical protein n=1 Tax=Nocardioides sp. TaxID=35761 RepID=UPI00351712F9
MVSVFLVMLFVLVLAAGVAVYAAYIDRGREVPGAPWLNRVAARAADAVPTLGEDDAAASSRRG